MIPQLSTTALNTEDLQRSLSQIANTWDESCNTIEFYLSASKAIKNLPHLADSKPYLIRDYIWIIAQFRIAHPQNKEVARISWASVVLLISMVRELEKGNRHILSSLCWLTDISIETLLEHLGAKAINSFISVQEQKKIDDLIIELSESNKEDLETLIANAQITAKEFTTLHHAAYFPSLGAKLFSLCKAAQESNEAGYWAKAALRYVHLEKDVIDDTQGYVGLLDDIHVIENMYSFVFGELPWKNLVEHASEMWPLLTRAHWLDEKTTNHLTALLKTIIACCLGSTLEDERTRTIILPEIGPSGFLSVASCVMASLDSRVITSTPTPGTLASFRDGHIARYVMIDQPYQSPDGNNIQMVKLKDCTRAITPEHALLLEPVRIPAVSLATDKQFNKWLLTIKADSKTAIRNFHYSDNYTSVIYLTNRSDFLNLLNKVQPYGRRLDELVSIEYRSRTQKTPMGSGSHTKNPTIIACNSIHVAEDALKSVSINPGKSCYFIIDRIIDHISLEALIKRAGQYNSKIKIITFFQLGARIRYSQTAQNESVWFIQPQDIESLNEQIDFSIPHGNNGLLAKYSHRLIRSSSVKFRTKIVEFPELDDFFEASKKIFKRTEDQQDADAIVFAISIETALRQISTYPPVGDKINNDRLISLLTNISQRARMTGMYDQDIDRLAPLSEKLINAIKEKNPKSLALLELLKDHKNCHVIVSSKSAAESLSKANLSIKDSMIKFSPIHDLENLKDSEILVASGWFGNKEMLDLQLGGWSETQIRLFYNFEHHRLLIQSRKLERTSYYLTERTRESWKKLFDKNPKVGNPPKTKPLKSVIENETSHDGNKNDLGQENWIETAVREQISLTSAKKRATIKGRLVFFDDGQHYGLFAENAKLTDTVVRQAKVKEKDYKLADGEGLLKVMAANIGAYSVKYPPLFITKWLAKVCRRTCAACSFVNSIVAFPECPTKNTY